MSHAEECRCFLNQNRNNSSSEPLVEEALVEDRVQSWFKRLELSEKADVSIQNHHSPATLFFIQKYILCKGLSISVNAK